MRMVHRRIAYDLSQSQSWSHNEWGSLAWVMREYSIWNRNLESAGWSLGEMIYETNWTDW